MSVYAARTDSGCCRRQRLSLWGAPRCCPWTSHRRSGADHEVRSRGGQLFDHQTLVTDSVKNPVIAKSKALDGRGLGLAVYDDPVDRNPAGERSTDALTFDGTAAGVHVSIFQEQPKRQGRVHDDRVYDQSEQQRTTDKHADAARAASRYPAAGLCRAVLHCLSLRSRPSQLHLW